MAVGDSVIHQAHRVYIAQHWADEWQLQDRLYCDGFSYAAGPDVGEAILRWNYGIIQPAESLQTLVRTPKDIKGWYVRVELEQAIEDEELTYRYWYGVIVEVSTDRRGTVTSPGVTAETGVQTFICRGLEFLLQRTVIDSSFVLDKEGSEIEIGRAIAFNLGGGRDTDHERHGNMSDTPGERDAPIFSFDIGVGGFKTTVPEKTWSVQDIITYLFRYHPPSDADGHDELNWTVPDGGDAEILSKIYPVAHAQGKTVKQLLDELIDRRRLVGYTIDVVGDDERPKLNVFTFNTTGITLPGGTTIPPNGAQFPWYFDNDVQINTAVIAEDDATRFDVVIVRGAPLGGCFTIAYPSVSAAYSDLVKDWDDTRVTAYNAGASASGTYAGLASIDKQAANQAFRADDIFVKVFRAFLLDPEFDGTVADGEEFVPVCPDPSQEDEEGNPGTAVSPFWYPGLRFLEKLPLRTDYDYTTVDGFEATTLTRTSSQPDYLRPFAVMGISNPEYDPDDEDSPEFFYYRLDKPGIGRATTELLQTNGINWAASLRMQDDCPGLFIDVHGAPQHVIAKDEFDPADADDEKDVELTVDWKNILCTIFCEFDQHCEVRYPSGPLTTTDDVVRELIIDLPNFRLDYLAPGTVIGVDNAGALLKTDGGYVRDDRALMSDIAACAFAWYGQTRKAMTITQHNLICDWAIGDMITNIGSAEAPTAINSVVTKIAFDLIAGTVTLTTQYAELDFAR